MAKGDYRLDWEEVAWDHGFKGDDKAMLTHYHHVEQLSQEAIGLKIGVSAATIGNRMKKLKVKVKRPPGYTIRYGPRQPKKGV